MTFYIPEFWCGVITTIVVQFVSIIVAAIAIASRDKKKKVEKEVDGLVGTYDDRGQWKESAEELKR